MEKELIVELKEKLKKGIVKFSYEKKDGTIREAEGTTKVSIIEEHNAVPQENSGYSYTDKVTRYYDTNSEGWRSFRNENLVSVDSQRTQKFRTMRIVNIETYNELCSRIDMYGMESLTEEEQLLYEKMNKNEEQ